MLCDVCQQLIYIGDDEHEHCGRLEDCPCGCAGNQALCVYAPSNTGLQADGATPWFSKCGYLVSALSQVCDVCGEIRPAAKA